MYICICIYIYNSERERENNLGRRYNMEKKEVGKREDLLENDMVYLV